MTVEKKTLKNVEEKDIELLRNEPEKFWGDANKIGKRAFWHITTLKEIEIPDRIVSIDDGAFAFCKNLKEISIPSSVKNIGKFALWGCENLETIFIPKSVDCNGENLFGGCKRLKTVIFEDKNHLPFGFKKELEFFGFDSYMVKENQIIFIRNIENHNSEENEIRPNA